MLPKIDYKFSLSVFTSTLFICSIKLSSMQGVCENGATINVHASVETHFIVSDNWAADQFSTVIREGDFLDGDFFTTSHMRHIQPAGTADCSYIVSAPAGYQVMVAILAMGLEEARGFTCLYYVEYEGTDVFYDHRDGRYCSSPTNGFLPDLLANQLQYTEGQYVNYIQSPYTSFGVRLTNQPPIVCSNNNTIKINVLNDYINGDQKYIGFVLSFRAVKGRHCGRCTTTSGDVCEFDNGVLPSFTSLFTHQCSTDIAGGQSQPSCYYEGLSDTLQIGDCDLTNAFCTIECISSETGDSCIFPFTLNGYTFHGCIEGQAVDSEAYTSSDYVCPLQYNESSNEYFDFKMCGGIGGSCSADPVPACFYNPCRNAAVCQNTNENSFGYTCDCGTSTGFIGQNCSAVDPCNSDPCNGGVCSVTGSDSGGFGFECNCSAVPDFLGDTCSVSNPCGPSNDPCNGGLCTITGDPSNGFGSQCNCSTVPTFLGDTCSLNNPCVPDPCHGGVCELTGDQIIGFSFICNCSSVQGFLGRHCNLTDPCSNPENPCNSNPCTVIVSNESLEPNCSCPEEGIIGDFCHPDPCFPNTCNGGACSVTKYEGSEFGFACNCSNLPEFIGDTCSNENPCRPSSNPCNGGICTVTGDSQAGFGFWCDCSPIPQFIGDTCSVENPCSPDPCDNGGICEITGDQQIGFNFLCNCSSVNGFLGRHCNISDPCTNPQNPCNSNPCVVIELNDVFEASCSCPQNGTVGEFCDPDPCFPNTCNGGECTVTVDQVNGFDFECNCSLIPDQLGETCSLDNPCLPDPCNGGVCDLTGDQHIGFDFLCNCSSVHGFLGNYCNITDPCTNPAKPCNSNPCTAIVSNESFEPNCSCPEEGTIGEFCYPDPCYPNTCNGGQCAVTGDKLNGFDFDCNCSAVPYFLGETCSLENPCLPDPCSGGICQILGDQEFGFDFSCNCSSVEGFLGRHCNITDPCTNPQNPCNSNYCSVVTENGFFEASCSCPEEGTIGEFCDADPCFPDTCNGGECTVTGSKQDGFGFQCNCSLLSDSVGDRCEYDDPCTPSPCLTGSCSIERAQNGSYEFICLCPLGTLQPVCADDPCDPDPCSTGNCSAEIDQNGILQSVCECPFGTFQPVCNDDPCIPNPCGSGTCSSFLINEQYQLDCLCPNTATVGRLCQDDPCLPNPCHLGSCNSFPTGDGLYESSCSCPDNSAGDFCEIDPCATTFCSSGSYGTPVSPYFEFISSSVCNISWTSSEDFINVSSYDYYVMLLNNSIIYEVPAIKSGLSALITSLDECQSYVVTIQPMRGEEVGKAAEFFIQNWDEPETVRQSFAKCGYCSNSNFTQLCSFPFNMGGTVHNTCVHKTGFESDGSLWCKNGKGVEMECTTTQESCLPPIPEVKDLIVQTLAQRVVEVTWSSDSPYFSHFDLFLNQDHIISTTNFSYVLSNLSSGSFYQIDLELESYGRKSLRKSVSFKATNTSRNAFAHETTTTATKLTWDSFEGINQNTTANATTIPSEIQIEANIAESELIRAMFTDEEISSMRQELSVSLDSSISLIDNLLPGVTYEFSITPLNLNGEVDSITTLETFTSTIPNQFEQSQNNLTVLLHDDNQSITLTGVLDRNSIADIIVITVYETVPTPIVIQDGEFQILLDVTEHTNLSDVSCLTTSSCVNKSSLQFQIETQNFEHKAGAAYIVELSGQTGQSQGIKSNITSLLDPNPVENLNVYSRDETSLRVSWQAPAQSFFRGFTVQYTDHNNQFFSVQIDGYLRYILYNLMPGFEYSISVFTFSDLEGNARSMPRNITTSTDLPELFQSRPVVVINDDSSLCFIWEVSLNRSQVFINSISVRISQSNWAAITSQFVTYEQAVGLQCFDLSETEVVSSSGIQLSIWAESSHPQLGRTSSSPRNTFTYSLNSGASIETSISTECPVDQNDVCLITLILAPPPPNLELFEITLKISRNSGSVRQRLKRSTESTEHIISGSSCDLISNTTAQCLFTVPAFMGDIDQVASFDICLFEFCLPGDFSDTIEKIDQVPTNTPDPNKENEDSASALIIPVVAGAAVMFVIAMAIITLVIFCKCRKSACFKTQKKEGTDYDYVKPYSTPSDPAHGYINPDLPATSTEYDIIPLEYHIMTNTNQQLRIEENDDEPYEEVNANYRHPDVDSNDVTIDELKNTYELTTQNTDQYEISTRSHRESSVMPNLVAQNEYI
ncbi:uncharacterized protein LOC142342791 isoform X3 [Convolutriloba macropyga]|uniref:uncharacterized protein LOC142342791 isoform X3 n=1 Tax=Convolutriloba macropyga TaxID=536237 RepID=UPI003F527474